MSFRSLKSNEHLSFKTLEIPIPHWKSKPNIQSNTQNINIYVQKEICSKKGDSIGGSMVKGVRGYKVLKFSWGKPPW